MTPKVPSITGNPALDSVLAAIILTVSAVLTTHIVDWLQAHGTNTPNMTEYTGILVLTILVSLVTAGWRALTARKIPQVIEDAQVVAANAALNMATKGQMLLIDANTPVPVTKATVKQIIADHGGTK